MIFGMIRVHRALSTNRCRQSGTAVSQSGWQTNAQQTIDCRDRCIGRWAMRSIRSIIDSKSRNRIDSSSFSSLIGLETIVWIPCCTGFIFDMENFDRKPSCELGPTIVAWRFWVSWANSLCKLQSNCRPIWNHLMFLQINFVFCWYEYYFFTAVS